MSETIVVSIEPWGPDDLWLVEKLMGDPEMTRYLGGPEAPEKLLERHRKYEALAPSGKGWMFRIVAATGETVGSVGYWDKLWRDTDVYEVGWSVLPPWQGRGIATAATTQAIDAARAEARHRYIHAFPSVANAASNAICRKLGFTFLQACDFEFPPGNPLRCNDWRLDLFREG